LSALVAPLHRHVVLLDVDAGFEAAVPAEHRLEARGHLVADVHELRGGPWTPNLATHDGRPGRFLLIVRGLVLREVVIAGRSAAQVFGPGDVLRPAECRDSSLAETVEWGVMDHATVVVLDDVFLRTACRWPGLHAVVYGRLLAQADRLAVQHAIAQLPNIEQRLLAMLWHLADRFGRMTTAGAVIPFKLTHETLGRLVGARRPTVSLGLMALHESAGLHRTPDGWVLDRDSHRLLGAVRPAALQLVTTP
jgi:CRP/FNR family cyclic AMP-dependent transcriptional regulator